MPKSTKIKKEEAIERIQNSFPKAEFTLLEYDGSKAPLKIKCEKCGLEQTVKSLDRIVCKVNFCPCQKDFQNTKDKTLFLLEQNKFELLEWVNSGQKIKIKCQKCQEIFSRYCSEIFRNPAYCPSCNDSITKPMSMEDIQKKIDNTFQKDNYQILNYENWRSKVYIKHLKCGLIFQQNVGHFLDGCGCPKCYRKRSKGEQSIELWLKENGISFITQYRIIYPDKTCGYCDFYIPEKKIVIEYNGEQHYDPNNAYNKREGFQKQKDRDQKKREYCFNNDLILIEIPYWELKNIPTILSLQFNDHSK